MSRNDLKVITPVQLLFSVTCPVASGSSNSIHRGEPTVDANNTASRADTVKLAGDADPTNANGHAFSGLAKNESTDTASTAGTVIVWEPLPHIVYSGKPKTAGSCNTAAKINALVHKRIILDLTTSVWTVDTAAADAAANGIVVVGGDPNQDVCYFAISPNVTVYSGAN